MKIAEFIKTLGTGLLAIFIVISFLAGVLYLGHTFPKITLSIMLITLLGFLAYLIGLIIRNK